MRWHKAAASAWAQLAQHLVMAGWMPARDALEKVHTSIEHVNKLVLGCIISLLRVVITKQLVNNNSALPTSILHNGHGWKLDRIDHDPHTSLLVL